MAVYPEDFGASASASNNRTQLINAINHAIATNDTLDGRGRTYALSSTINLPLSRPSIQHITFDMSQASLSTSDQGPRVLRMEVPQAQALNKITANASLGAVSVSGSFPSLNQGDWVWLRSDKQVGESQGNDGRYPTQSQLLQVSGRSSSSVTFYGTINDLYRTSDNARLYKIETRYGVDFKDVHTIGGVVGCEIVRGFRSKYENCGAVTARAAGFTEVEAVLTACDGVWSFAGNSTEVVYNKLMYGLQLRGCHQCSYGDVIATRVRHVISDGYGSVASGYPISDNNVVGNVRGIGCSSSVVDQHPGGGWLQVGDVYAEGQGDYGGAIAQFEGAGGSLGHLSGIGTGTDINFNSWGFIREGFHPTVIVDSVQSNNNQTGIEINNNTGRWNPALGQTLTLSIGSYFTSTKGRAINCYARSGDVEFFIGGGSIFSNDDRALAFANASGDRNGFKVYGRLTNTDLLRNSGDRVAQVEHGSELTMIGGSAGTRDGGTTGFRVQNGAVLRQVMVEDASVVYDVYNDGVRRALS